MAATQTFSKWVAQAYQVYCSHPHPPQPFTSSDWTKMEQALEDALEEKEAWGALPEQLAHASGAATHIVALVDRIRQRKNMSIEQWCARAQMSPLWFLFVADAQNIDAIWSAQQRMVFPDPQTHNKKSPQPTYSKVLRGFLASNGVYTLNASAWQTVLEHKNFAPYFRDWVSMSRIFGNVARDQVDVLAVWHKHNLLGRYTELMENALANASFQVALWLGQDCWECVDWERIVEGRWLFDYAHTNHKNALAVVARCMPVSLPKHTVERFVVQFATACLTSSVFGSYGVEQMAAVQPLVARAQDTFDFVAVWRKLCAYPSLDEELCNNVLVHAPQKDLTVIVQEMDNAMLERYQKFPVFARYVLQAETLSAASHVDNHAQQDGEGLGPHRCAVRKM